MCISECCSMIEAGRMEKVGKNSYFLDPIAVDG